MSKLFYWINPNSNKVKVVYIYFLCWFNFKVEVHDFELSNDLTMKIIYKTFEKLTESYDRKFSLK